MITKLIKHTVIRYIISGGTSASFDLILLYILNSVLHMHYIYAAIIAFMAAFFISFILQKFWTFKNISTVKVHRQVVLYLGTSLVGLSFNTLLMYLFVSHGHFNVIVAQICAGAIVACFTFFLSRHVFKNEETLEKEQKQLI